MSSFATVEEQKADMQKRYKLENERYFKVYGVRKDDMSNYDLVIDVSETGIDGAVDKIIDLVKKV